MHIDQGRVDAWAQRINAAVVALQRKQLTLPFTLPAPLRK